MHGSASHGGWIGVEWQRWVVAWTLVALVAGGVVRAQTSESLIELPRANAPQSLSVSYEPLIEIPLANTPQSLSDSGEPMVQADEPLMEGQPAPAASAPSTEPAITTDQPAAATTPVTISSRTDFVILMNEAIAIFNRNQGTGDYTGRAAAADKFKALLQHDPDNKTCIYHLGLIEIRNGISYSSDAASAIDTARKPETDPNKRGQLVSEASANDRKAKEAFDAAREYFKKLIELDAALRATEGGLYLGIAQLALDEGVSVDIEEEKKRVKRQINSDAFLENNENAEEILKPYVESPEGRNDPYGRFFLGIARFRLGLRDDMKDRRYHEQSMKDFEDSKTLANTATIQASEYEVILDKFLLTVDYYEGLIYAIDKKRPEAIRIFEQLAVNKELTDRVRTNAQNILTALQDQTTTAGSPHMSTVTPLGALSLEGNVGVGNFYDTNVILLGKHQALPYGITKRDDYRFGLDAGLDATLFADEATFKRNNWFGKSLLVGVGAQNTNLWQPSINEYQINTYGGRAYINYEPVANVYLGLRYDYTWAMLGSDPFFGSHRIIPSVAYSWKKDFDRDKDEIARTDIYYLNDYREYHDKIPDYRFDRTGEYQGFGITQAFNLVKAEDLWNKYYDSREANSKEQLDRDRWSRIWVGYTYRDEQTKGTEFDLVGDTLLFGFEIPLPMRLAFDFRAGWIWDDYDNPSALDYRGNARHDMIQDYTFGVTYTIIAPGQYQPWESLEMKLRGTIQTIIEDSNVWNRFGEEAYTYNRNIYGLQLLINF